MPSPWSALEAVRGLVNFRADWRLLAGDQFDALSLLCLQPSSLKPESYPCPAQCGCWHRIIPRHDGTGAVAACRCEPPACPDFPLTIEDITPLEVNRAKLGRALCKALLLNSKTAEFGLPFTTQIGSWSANAVPAILTILPDHEAFRRVVPDLVATLNQPFILLAPTANHLDARSLAHLSRVRAAFFPLETTVTLTPAGTLLPVKPPGELFAQFTPQPKEIDQTVAQRAFALVQQLESDPALPPPTPLAVFRLYCIEALSAAQAARKCHCSKATIFNRLALIRQKTGIDPANLRTLSPHIASMENEISDPRARHIHRASLIDSEDADRPDD
ncbi:MAG TPA: hypothetical protein VNZ64_23120 [Candidatus Acidoferrum sp.]|jgi:hypothetical protein|nr:hypothetical protein [Candidatus Acidoferrum sp.]